jgi:hypothetical protein
LHIRTNRAAARTVDSHVDHLRTKLDLRSLAEVAIWVHERQAADNAGPVRRPRRPVDP